MSEPRRFIPSTAALMAFDAVARTGSFTRAANEISLTQSAVSRQVQALEEQLSCSLFERNSRTVELTDAGSDYAEEIGEALTIIRDATIQLVSDRTTKDLSVAILPTFGTRWLMPRIPRFVAKHPEITLNFTTRIGRFDFTQDGPDAAIYHGTPDWPGVECTLLMLETIVPVASPGFVQVRQDLKPASLLHLPRLFMKSRPTAWRSWFASHGIEVDENSGMSFEHFSTLVAACIAGMGVALVPELLIKRELEQRDLVRVGETVMNDEAYFFAEPARRVPSMAGGLFKQWLLEEVEG